MPDGSTDIPCLVAASLGVLDKKDVPASESPHLTIRGLDFYLAIQQDDVLSCRSVVPVPGIISGILSEDDTIDTDSL